MNIFIKLIVKKKKKKSVFSRVRSTSENLNVFLTEDENIYSIYKKKNHFILSF